MERRASAWIVWSMDAMLAVFVEVWCCLLIGYRVSLGERGRERKGGEKREEKDD